MSVITPTYADRARRLQSALASIWAQEGLGEQFDVEPIVVDNASSGPIEEVVRRFARTRYVRLDTNRGQAVARNIGLREATGEYVAFLDHDDLWLPHRLSVQVPVLERSQELEVVYSQFINVREDGTSNVEPDPTGPSGWIFEAVFKAFGKGHIVHVPTILVPRAAFDIVGEFDERIPGSDDVDMWLRLALRFPFRYVPGSVAVFMKSQKVTRAWHDEKTRSWVIRRDKILGLVQDAPNEADLRRLIMSGTELHLVQVSLMANEFGEARRRLLHVLQQHPMSTSDDDYRSRVRDLAVQLIPADSSLGAELARTGRGKNWRHRLRLRGLAADVWTQVALKQASDRNDRTAGAAAARALLQNPLKVLSRPGLLRLLARPAWKRRDPKGHLS